MAKNTGAVAEKPAPKIIPTRVIGEPPSKAKPVIVTIRSRGKIGLRLTVWGDYDTILGAVVASVDPDAPKHPNS